MVISALVFGSLGTLTETSHLHQRAFNDTFIDEGLGWHWDLPIYQRLLRVVGGGSRIVHYSRETGDGPVLTEAEAEDLQAKKTARYVELLRAEGVELRPGVERLFAEAAAAGLALGLATGTSMANLTANLDAAGRRLTLDAFDAYTVRSEGVPSKPAPDLHRMCIARLDADPAATVAIEDTTDGVVSAAGAGAMVVATPGDYVTDHDFSAATVVVDCLGDPERPASLVPAGPEEGTRPELPELPEKMVTLEWLASIRQ
ncbi:MAG: HAD-IA family hydrolase [Actinomycetota bacterium]